MRILIIEDNVDLAANLFDFLEAGGHVVDAAADGITGMNLVQNNPYDAIVLDLMLPRMDGITLCRKLRNECNINVPILIITARDSLEDKIIGLEAGADDYLVKPIELREVELRLRVLLRRGALVNPKERIVVEDLVMEVLTRTVRRDGKIIELPPVSYRILEVLMAYSPNLVSRKDVEFAVWGDSPPDSDSLRAHLHLLRNLIDKPFERKLLRTVRGFGYKLVSPDAPD